MTVARSIHFQNLGQAHEQAEIIRTSDVPIVKIVNSPGTNPFPGKRVIIREMDPNETNMVRSGVSGARVWWEHNEARMRERSWAWAFEVAANEQPCKTPQQCGILAAYQIEWMRQARLRGFTQKLLAGVFSTGVPEPEYAPLFGDMVKLCDYMAFHEYWGRGGPDDPDSYTWLTQRYRRFYDALGFTKPTFITEAGICLGDPLGWKDAGITAEQYAIECIAYCDECQEDGYVEGVFFFTAGGGDKWKRFELTPQQTQTIVDSNRHLVNLPIISSDTVTTRTPASPEIKYLHIDYGLGAVPFIDEVRPPMLNIGKRWYLANNHPSIPDHYEGHPERCVDINLEAGGNSDLGEPVVASFTAAVVDAVDLTDRAGGRSWGKTVRIVGFLEDGHFVCWRGCHLDSIEVARGQIIRCGDSIGTIGHSGTQYAHLHFDISIDRINPIDWHPQNHMDAFVDPIAFYLKHGVDTALMERLVRWDGQ
ncbi:MAG TPA: peptidoglycan DD-metalloendopeptidase family protein [Sedimentisphaerales bacterium]|nr:peptidoglycan DD-metalloendopeptidase family protein [Sedimentisphaerales bacterium]